MRFAQVAVICASYSRDRGYEAYGSRAEERGSNDVGCCGGRGVRADRYDGKEERQDVQHAREDDRHSFEIEACSYQIEGNSREAKGDDAFDFGEHSFSLEDERHGEVD